ncbi:MAG: RNA polymerase sigma factor [Myxococcales bacterium]|nr:RNA polymerase sigma factor [Myxococcales bacterium]
MTTALAPAPRTTSNARSSSTHSGRRPPAPRAARSSAPTPPPTVPPPSQVRARAAQGAESELRRAVASLRHDLYVRALRMARSPALAEDLVQDTVVRALRFEAQYRPGTNARAWLVQILRSVFLTLCRRQKRERKAVDRLTTDPCEWTRGDSRPACASLSTRPAAALACLPEGYRRAVELVDLGESSYQDAAETLGVPVGTIMSRLHRGRRLLATALAEPVNVPPSAEAA